MVSPVGGEQAAAWRSSLRDGSQEKLSTLRAAEGVEEDGWLRGQGPGGCYAGREGEVMGSEEKGLGEML